MCGIIGYIGKNNSVPYLIKSLENLEYRGYDSAGIAVVSDKKIKTVKKSGRLINLELALKDEKIQSNIGIGHTRWATHGKPSDENSHPHSSMNGLFSVVHNGIIENYAKLKLELISQGYEFKSETDSEVIAHLLEKNYNGDLLQTIKKTTDMLEGSYAICAVCTDFEDQLICARCLSPLVLGSGEGENFVCSDITAILSFTRKFYSLDTGEFCLVNSDDVKFYNNKLKPIKKETTQVDWSVQSAQKSGYEHFMLKEIMQQPTAVSDTINSRIKDDKVVFEKLNLTEEKIKSFNKIFVVACGSAYHVGVVAKYVFEQMLKVSTEVEIASEFRYREPIVDEKTLCIIISQSGETADTLAALQEAKRLGAYTLSLVNVLGSSIANQSDDVLYTFAGPEIAVATTKAYSTQLSLIYLIGAYFAECRNSMKKEDIKQFLSQLKNLPQDIQSTLDDCQTQIKTMSKLFLNCEHAYYIGRNLDYAIALEASLKMKEISYIHSEAYGAGELKHGTISLIEDGTLLVALACSEKLFFKTVSSIKETTSRGANAIVLTSEKFKDEVQQFKNRIIIKSIHPLLMPSIEVIPMQLLSYYTAKRRGCDIDKPRNLAKSVTVE